jgi:hypothetical protein
MFYTLFPDSNYTPEDTSGYPNGEYRTRDYTVHITVKADGDNSLAELGVVGAGPIELSGGDTYTASVHGSVLSLNVSAQAASVRARTQILEAGDPVLAPTDDGFEYLKADCNRTVPFPLATNPESKELKVVVTAESGNKKEYALTVSRGSSPPLMAEGGTPQFILDNGINYEVHTFTASGSLSFFNASTESIVADYLIVAGGGGAGGPRSNNGADMGGGGGAGGLLYQTGETLDLTGGSVTVTVGRGGYGGNVDNSGQDGDYSSIGNIAVPGGGFGGRVGSDGNVGGSGGSGGGNGSNTASSSESATTSTGKTNTASNTVNVHSGVLGNGGGIAGGHPGGGGGGATSAGATGSGGYPGPAGAGGAGWKPSEAAGAAWITTVTGTTEFAHGGAGGQRGESTAAADDYGDGGEGSSASSRAGRGGIVIIRFPYSGGTE